MCPDLLGGLFAALDRLSQHSERVIANGWVSAREACGGMEQCSKYGIGDCLRHERAQ
jgi:hypothetical protein